MSGGSYDYLCYSVEQAADRLCRREQSPLRREFAAHLRLVAAALHDVEWVDSSDYAPGDEDGAIRAVLVDAKRRAERHIADDALVAARALVEALEAHQ